MSRVVYLKELIEIKNGKDYRKLEKGKIPVYGTGGVIAYVNDFLYDGESILLPRKGSLNNIMYIDNDKFWTVDTMYWSVVKKEKVYPKYLFCYLSLLNLSSRDTGSTLPSMTFDSYYTLPIKLYDYEIQKKIGDLYFKLTQKIELNNKINSELEAMAKIIYDYWFLQFEFPNEEGKPYKSSGGKMVWNEELKREIPEGWEVKKIIDIANLYQPKGISEKELNPNGRYLVFGANGVIGKYNEYNHEEREIAVCCRGASCGKFLMTVPMSWITGNAMIITPSGLEFGKEFIYYSLSYNKISKFITGSAQPQITRENLKNMTILTPKKEISKKFEKIALNIREEKENLFKENEELTSLRDFLLPLLMNGQVGFKGE